MTLTELLTTMETQGYISASRVKDVKTSLRYLARALGKDTPAQCQQSDFLLDPTVWKEKLDIYFLDEHSHGKAISPHTLRNTRNNLSFFFRTAQDKGLITPPQSLSVLYLTTDAASEVMRQTSPYRQTYQRAHSSSYGLSRDNWPLDIQTAWNTYCLSRHMNIRQTTLRKHEDSLTRYILRIDAL